MATYKVIQDVEAEDHILGPLTLRQFIYALAAVLFLYLSFLAFSKHASFMLVVLLPPAITAGFFAFPFGKDQPTEVWALARLRFMLMPRRRLWNQGGAKELVSITAPKRTEKQLTNGLSQTEVNDRLQALALMIDSRGWAIKNMQTTPNDQTTVYPESDRLVDVGSIPKPVPDYDLLPEDDILDELNNPIAAQMSEKIKKSADEHRQKIMASLNSLRSSQANTVSSIDEQTLSSQLKAKASANKQYFSKMHNSIPVPKTDIQLPIADSPIVASSSQLGNKTTPESTSKQASDAKVMAPTNTTSSLATTQTDPVILNLAFNNDLNVATLDHEANRSKSNDEVVIKLR